MRFTLVRMWIVEAFLSSFAWKTLWAWMLHSSLALAQAQVGLLTSYALQCQNQSPSGQVNGVVMAVQQQARPHHQHQTLVRH